MEPTSRHAASLSGPRLDVLSQPEDDVGTSLDARHGEVAVAATVDADDVPVGEPEQLGDGPGVDQVGRVDEIRHIESLVDGIQQPSYVGGLQQHEAPPAPLERPGGRTREGLALMPTVEDTRPSRRDVTPGHCFTARCEACGLGYEVDLLGASDVEQVGDCNDCGGPLYLIPVVDLVEMIEACAACVAAGVECDWHAGFAAGWDACVALVAGWVGERRDAELAGPAADSDSVVDVLGGA
jgi:hypothetical protein